MGMSCKLGNFVLYRVTDGVLFSGSESRRSYPVYVEIQTLDKILYSCTRIFECSTLSRKT